MAAMHNFLKRIEIRLNRSEVTNYLSSIGKTPALQPEGTVAIKVEPRDDDEVWPVIMKTESLYKPEQYEVDADISNLNGTEDELPFIIKIEPLESTAPEVGAQKKGFQCPTFHFTFKYRLHLKHHQNTNDGCAQECYQTNEPKLKDKHGKRQATNTSNSNERVKHSCPKCKKKCDTPKRLRRHMTVHRKKPHKRYVCAKCLTRFKYESKFFCHTRTEHLFKCEHCELAFPYKSSLDGHMTKCHQEGIAKMGHSVGIKDGERGAAVARSPLPCPECNKIFTKSNDLRRHVTVHSNEIPFVCSKCQLPFKFKSSFDRHIRKEHLFKCVNCELSFLMKVSVEAHVLKCHAEDNMTKIDSSVDDNTKKSGTASTVSRPKYSCPECKKEFSTFKNVQRHKTQIHSNHERSYACSTCLHTFKSPAYRDRHTRKEHRFQCLQCELSFVHKPSLEEHSIKDHQAVSRKIFSCPECEKGFSLHCNLLGHMWVHSNETPHVCSTCLHTFKNENTLMAHARKNHGFKCDKCSLLFICKKHLTHHMSTTSCRSGGYLISKNPSTSTL